MARRPRRFVRLNLPAPFETDLETSLTDDGRDCNDDDDSLNNRSSSSAPQRRKNLRARGRKQDEGRNGGRVLQVEVESSASETALGELGKGERGVGNSRQKSSRAPGTDDEVTKREKAGIRIRKDGERERERVR